MQTASPLTLQLNRLRAMAPGIRLSIISEETQGAWEFYKALIATRRRLTPAQQFVASLFGPEVHRRG
jgi:hypothetical protein